MSPKYKKIIQDIEINEADLEGPVEDVMAFLYDLCREYGKDATLSSRYYDDWVLSFERLETEVEYDKRIKKEKKKRENHKAYKAKCEEGEKKELAKLIKKYGVPSE